MRIKPIAIAIVVIAASFFASLKLMDWVSPRATVSAPVLAKLPPLPSTPRTSTILAPITVPLSVIRDAVDRAAPKTFSGKANNPAEQILQNADISWTASRGAMTASGAQSALTLSTPLTGTLHVTGQLSANAKGAIGDALGSLLGSNVAKQIGGINIKNINADAEIRGNVTMTAKPTLAANWRVDPNLLAQVNLGDTNVSVAGVKVSVPAQVKPVIDKAVNDQLAGLQNRIRNDPLLETNARLQWDKMCRSIALQSASSALQGLWLEMKPTKAIAAQPRVDGASLLLTLGIEAETRVTPTETKPSCPFPATLAIVPQGPGRLSIGVPIDIPFTELSKIIEAEVAGRTYPEDGNGPVDVTVKHASVAAAGDRLLISLLVNAKEKKSFFGFGAEATVHIWGRPTLDQTQQILKLKDIELAVESEAAFGLLGQAARAAMPYVQKSLAERAAVDLKPMASGARKRIAAVIADMQKNEESARIDGEITSLQLAGIAFDSTTLRVIAQAEGSLSAEVRKLPGL